MAIGTTAAVLGATALSAGVGLIGSKKAADAQSKAARNAQEYQERIYLQNREDLGPARESGDLQRNALMYELGLGPRIGYKNTLDDFNADYYLASNEDVRNSPYGANPEMAAAHFRDFGMGEGRAGNALARPYGGFEATGAYQFNRSEGLRAIDSGAAARGNALSGGTMKAAQRYGSGLAAQEYNNYLNRLSGGVSQGQQATSQTAVLGANFANMSGQNALAAGQAGASGYMNATNAINSSIGDGLGLAAYTGAI